MTSPQSNVNFFSQRYIIQDQLGLGGMGAVYRATDRLTGDVVALKRVFAPVESLVFNTFASNEDLRIALAQEFQVLASMRHPNIINVLEYGFDTEQQPYFTMELLKSARSIVGASRFQSVETKMSYVIQMLQALDYLHRRGILHRDLKPANVLVENNRAKILDFGLAMSLTTVPEEAVGTVAYMAPELLEDGSPSIASDLFAVGVMMYEMFAGEHPFDPSGNIMEMIYRISVVEPDYFKMELPTQVTNVVQKLLAKKPSERYQDAHDVINDLTTALGQAPPQETEELRESYLQAAKLVGRKDELAHLENALTNLVSGEGSAWLIGGESGVGKSRLVEEARIRALVSGAHVVRGECTADSGLPYHLWRQPLRRLVLTSELTDLQIDILRQVVPDINQLLGREPGDSTYTGRQALVDTIVSVIHSQKQPVVLILEDLQWAAESLEILKRVSRTISDIPVMILGSYRNDERPSLPEHLPEMQLISLERLGSVAIEELSYSMLGDAGRNPSVIQFLQRQTEGNVFFLVEVVRALAQEAGSLDKIGSQTLPMQVFTGGMQSIIRHRLSQVPNWGQPLLQIASLIGREIDESILRAVLPTLENPPKLEQWLISCGNAAVLEVREGSWRFAHDKLRAGVIQSIGDDNLPHLNRQIAQAIESTYPDASEYAAKLAQHWGAAGDKQKQWHYARLAGKQALEISVYHEAIESFKLALDLTSQIGQTDYTADLMCGIGKAHRYLGEFDKASEFFKKALELARTSQDTATQTEALIQLGRVENNQGRHEEAMIYATQALEIARRTGDETNEGDALSQLGDIYRQQGNTDEAINFHQQALAITRKIGNKWLEGISLDFLGGVYNDLNQYDRAIEYRLDALKLFRENGNRRSEGIALSNLGRTYTEVFENEKALEAFERALKIARDIGDLAGEGICLDNLADFYSNMGQYEKAMSYYESSIKITRDVHNRPNEANRLSDMARIRMNQGMAKEAVEMAEQAYLIAHEIEDQVAECEYSIILGWAHLANNNLDQARTSLYRASMMLATAETMHRANAAFGVACLRDGDENGAENAFNKALGHVRKILDVNSADFRAHYIIGLTLAGLALIHKQPLTEALESYKRGVTMTPIRGLLLDEIRQIQELAKTNRGDLSEIIAVLNPNQTDTVPSE